MAIIEATAMIIVRDIFSGIQHHFKARVTEWIMAFPTGAMALGLSLDPNMFSHTPSYNAVTQWASGWTWMWVILFCFFARMGALVVNGTFRGFRHSPHLRVIASFTCFNFWAWLSYGFLTAFIFHGGSFPVVPATISLCMIEGLNIFRGTSDIALQHAELKRAGQWTGRRYPSRKF